MSIQPSRDDLIAFASIMAEIDRREGQKLYYRLFPDETFTLPNGRVIHARALYPKHIEFFAAGATYRERCFLAGNRVGKTVAGGFEVSAHLTGDYRDWWEGRRFTRPTEVWAAGKNNETTRDIVQRELLGDVTGSGPSKGFSGTGLIPGARIGRITWKQGVADLADTVLIRHESGGWSKLGLKSYEQGRGSFEGTAKHVIWFDEEPPMDVYGEALIRTATTNGLLLVTFTPLEGMSEVVLSFVEQDMVAA